jgi:urease accessory protein
VYRFCPASQSVLPVDAEGVLVVLPDPIVCFAAANFTQSQRYELHGNASLVLVDWMTSGRHATGERWAFSRYESRLFITRDSRPILNDAIVLERDADSIVERMGRFEVLLTAVLSGPLVSKAADTLLAGVARAPVVKHADLLLSASKLGDGSTLLRMAGTGTEQVGRALRDALSFLTPLLGDDPWSRKW